MNAKLVILSGATKNIDFVLPEGLATLGRESASDFSFDRTDDVVSGIHASIRFEGGRYILRDEGSRNGTFVNSRRVQEQELRDGDVVEFGMGGPTARFEHGAMGEAAAYMGTQATQHVGRAGAVTRMLRDARQVGGGRPTVVMKEFVRMAYEQSSRRARRMSITVAVVALAVIGGVWANGERDQRAATARFSVLVDQLQQQGEAREAIQAEVEQLQVANTAHSLDVRASQAESEAVRRELAEAQARAEDNRNFVAEVSELYSESVVFLSFGWGWQDGAGRILRYQLDDDGMILMTADADGDLFPVIEPDGNGPPVGGSEGVSCTGFLIDQEGWIVTNRHCAVPWAGSVDAADAEFFQDLGWEMRFIDGGPTVYFPTDAQGAVSSVEAISMDADVALLRIPPVSHLPLPLGAPGELPEIGELLVLAGYPTGLEYITQSRLQGEQDWEAYQAAERSGEAVSFLIDRDLLYPFVAVGRVNDLAAGEIVHDANTYGGASGSPVFGEQGEVVGVHHASNPFDLDRETGLSIRGTDFTIRLAAQVSFLWEILPTDVRNRLARRN